VSRRAIGLAGAAAAVALAACGGGEDARSGALLWADGPRTARTQLTPKDRIVGGTIRNDSLRPLDLVTAGMRLVDEDGRRVKASITFQLAPGHTLWPTGRVNLLPAGEQLRLGMRARLKPGDETPFVVAWRSAPGARPPVRVEYDGGSLPLALRSR
jgi:hypothetical protein